MKKKTKIHNASFLISPTTHLFPLSGQSGSRGVSSMITLNLLILKACNENSKYTMSQNTTELKIVKKCKKPQNAESPLGDREWDRKSLL